MENRGYYVNAIDPGKEEINLFINIDQFIEYLQQERTKGLPWIKFTIYKNSPGSKFSHNIKQQNRKDHGIE